MIRFHRNGLRYEPFVDDVEQLRPGYWITITMGTDTFTPALTSPAGVVYGAPAKTLRTAIKRANDLCVINDALLQPGETKPVIEIAPRKDPIKVEITVPDDTVLTLLVSAFEGGSNYWYTEVKHCKPACIPISADEYYPFYVWNPVNGGSVAVTDEAGTVHTLDAEAIRTGLRVMLERYPKHFADAITGNGDSETGDVFLQCCLWGKAIYG